MKTRALYLLIWDAESEREEFSYETIEDKQHRYRNYELTYWLDYVRAHSRQSPVIVVQNKMDRPGIGKQRPPSVNELDKMYRVADYHSVSAHENKGFAGLWEVIEATYEQMPELGMEMPHSWHTVGKKMEKMATLEKDISQEQFEAACAEAGVREVSPPSLLRYLHDTGVVFYQKDLFQNRIILDQRWAIEAIYLIFDRNKPFYRLRRGEGTFHFSDLDIPLLDSEYTPEKRKVILSFMESCEICFPANRNQTKEADPLYIAPELLPDEQPAEVQAIWRGVQEESLYVRYEHPILHKGLITRFIVRAGHLADLKNMWRNGICIQYQSSIALVESLPARQAGIIHIRVSGPRRDDLLERIRKEFK